MNNYYLPERKLTVQEIDEITDFMQLAYTDKKSLTISYNILNKLNKQYDNSEKFEFVGISIDLLKFFLKTSTEVENYFKHLSIIYFNKNKQTANLFWYLKKAFLKKKTLFTTLDIYGYGHTEGEDYPYDTHSIMLVFLPLKNNYKLIVINPHGRDLTYDYEVIFSSKRIKKIHYKKGIDYEFMNMFMTNLNKYLKKDTNILVEFDNTEKTFYRGVNLQSGDSRGYCYLFPIVFFHYFRLYFNTSRNLGYNLNFNSSSKLLKSGNIDEFITNCLVDFCKPYKKKVVEIGGCKNIKHYYEDFEYILLAQDFRLFKKMAAKHLIRCEEIFWDIEEGLFN